MMNNKVVFAAAGNGKTYNICGEAIKNSRKSDKSILIITYTNEGIESIKSEFQMQNCGALDSKVTIKTWYSFLLSDLIKPYQCSLQLNYKRKDGDKPLDLPEHIIKSIVFYEKEEPAMIYTKSHYQYYMNNSVDIHKNRVSVLANKCIEDSNFKPIHRLENIYSHIYFDELQDYAGYDLEIFRHLFESRIEIQCVGDYKQATFRTNNSQKNKMYRDDKIKLFFEMLEKKGKCKICYDNSTRRFNAEICEFINLIHNDKESYVYPDYSVVTVSENQGVYIIENKYLSVYCNWYNPTILTYNKNSQVKFTHTCDVINYGNSKGATFERVVIIPVGTVMPFIENRKIIKSPQTKSKFYVASTRAKHSIVFAMDKLDSLQDYEKIEINLGSDTIPAYKFKKGKS